MAQSRPKLNPDEGAALTRLVLSYCLGRGSISLCSRTYSLQLHQPKAHQDYVHYQWRRLRQFLPTTREPRYYPSDGGDGGTGQWRLRVSSKSFETAFHLLYPKGFLLSSAVLELLGAEAIAALWADRGRVILTRGAHYCNGRLNLSRYKFEEAELVLEWIARLTGSQGQLHHGPRSTEAPMLYYDSEATENLINAVRSTWMAQAECLERKFKTPRRFLRDVIGSERDLRQATLMLPQVRPRRASGPLLQRRESPGRRIPGHPPAPVVTPPVIKQAASQAAASAPSVAA